MGNLTQKRQIAILSAVIILSTIMITGMVASSIPLFDQKADAIKSKLKKSTSKIGANGANGVNGAKGANGGASSSGSSGTNGANGVPASTGTNGASGVSGTSGGRWGTTTADRQGYTILFFLLNHFFNIHSNIIFFPSN
jgi:hypothetical protein